MADLKLKDFVDENDLQKLVELDNTIERVRADYVNAAKELAKGLKLNVEGVADLEKLSNLYNTQAKTAGSASAELTEALRKQSEITQTVSKKIEEKLNVEKLSAAELKKLGFEVASPDGAFYLFAKIPAKCGTDSWAFVRDLAPKAKVALIPGVSFGPGGESYVRFSYAASMENLKEVVARLTTYLANI